MNRIDIEIAALHEEMTKRGGDNSISKTARSFASNITPTVRKMRNTMTSQLKKARLARHSMLTVEDDKSVVSDNQTYKPNEGNLFRSEIDFMNKIQESNKQH